MGLPRKVAGLVVGGLAPALQEAADDDEAVLTKTFTERTGAPGDLAMVRPVYAGVRTPDSVRARRESLLGWVALKLRSKAFLMEDMRTFASHGRAVLFYLPGQPVSSSTPGSLSLVGKEGDVNVRTASISKAAPGCSGHRARPPRGTRWTAPARPSHSWSASLRRCCCSRFCAFAAVLCATRESRARDLRDKEEQFRALATSSPVGICLLDHSRSAAT